MKEDDGDVLYSDVKFTKNKKKAKETDVSKVDTTTYAEVNFRKPQQNPEAPAVSQRVKPSPGSKVRVEKAVLVIVGFLLIAAGVALGVITFEYMKTKETLRSEKVKWEADKANLTETLKSCPTARPPVCPTTPKENQETCFRCDEGWELYETKCYYFSTDLLSWNDSKVRCMNQSGNLVQINSRDEQTFLANKLKTEMKENEDKFWIGLTDAAEEGEWRWVDGSKLDENLRFWSGNEPDNWKGEDGAQLEGENCVRMGEKGQSTVLYSWFDQFCKNSHKWICEKAAESGKRSSVCVSETSVK